MLMISVLPISGDCPGYCVTPVSNDLRFFCVRQFCGMSLRNNTFLRRG